MEPNPPRTIAFRRNRHGRDRKHVEPVWIIFLLAMLGIAVGSAHAMDFVPDEPESEYLPAAAGEPSVDFCANWNPEFGYRGYRCCSNGAVSRNVAGASSKRGRRSRKNSCAPDRIKWTFCDEMTPEQREYITNVKAGKIDALDTIEKNFGSRGGQAFCSAGNGFLVEGRPLVPMPAVNRIELRNEGRCANFGTDPLVGALEWTGREIKKEYFEPEFKQARMIIGDISAPRGGCVAGRGGRRAHKSHTAGIDVDLAYFNPRSGHDPEEHFTKTFYVASNWWFLKKVFRNPFACVKVIFVDRSHINALARYAKNDPEWSKLKPFIRHVRGHRDHFHIRFGSGPGVAGCQSDPNLEEDEDMSDAPDDGVMVKGENGANDALAAKDEDSDDLESSIDPVKEIVKGRTTEERAERRVASLAPDAAASTDTTSLAAQTTLPPHKLEPSITAQYEEKKHSRRRRSKKTRIGKK